MKFTESQLESAIIILLKERGYPYSPGVNLEAVRQPNEALLKDDLRQFISHRYPNDQITPGEIDSIIRQLESYPAADLYGSNKAIHKLVSDGFLLKWEDPNQVIPRFRASRSKNRCVENFNGSMGNSTLRKEIQ